MKRVIALICFVVMIFTLASCKKNNETENLNTDIKNTAYTDGEIIKFILSPYGSEEIVGINQTIRNYVSVTSNGYLDVSQLKFIVDNPKIASISYDSTALEDCVYYKIEGKKTGKTTAHIESTDGKVRSEEINITVQRDKVKTSATVCNDIYSYKYHTTLTEYISRTTKTTTTETSALTSETQTVKTDKITQNTKTTITTSTTTTTTTTTPTIPKTSIQEPPPPHTEKTRKRIFY